MDAGPQARTSPEHQLEAVAEIARRLAETEDADQLLQRIVDLATEYLECDGASLMLIGSGGRMSTPAYSSPVARDSDLAQYAADEGPCLESIRQHHTVLIDDLVEDRRWPEYRRRVLALDIRSMLGLRLFILGDTMGALDLYSSRAHHFGAREVILGQVFASHAAVALKASIAEAGLEAALRSRDTIGQAKGVVMVRDAITADAAFERLRQMSQRRNQRLVDLADEVVRTGELPPG